MELKQEDTTGRVVADGIGITAGYQDVVAVIHRDSRPHTLLYRHVNAIFPSSILCPVFFIFLMCVVALQPKARCTVDVGIISSVRIPKCLSVNREKKGEDRGQTGSGTERIRGAGGEGGRAGRLKRREKQSRMQGRLKTKYIGSHRGGDCTVYMGKLEI